MAISIKPGESDQALWTDGEAGFWDFRCRNYHQGQGYTIGTQPVLLGLAFYTTGGLVDRSRPESEVTLYPWGVDIQTPAGGYRQALLKNRQTILIEPHSGVDGGYLEVLLPGENKDWRQDSSGGITGPVQIRFAGGRIVKLKSPGDSVSPWGKRIFEDQPVAVVEWDGHSCMGIHFDQDPEVLPFEKALNETWDFFKKSYFWCDQEDLARGANWAKYSAYSMVTREFGKGIWAGLPWFKDNWGRDTFIALPGCLLVTGAFDEAREVIERFSSWQLLDKKDKNYGRVPNRVTDLETMIYNTTDGTPWLIREIREYMAYSGDRDFAKEVFPFLERAIEGALQNYVDDQGFLTHTDPDTWMDAKIAGQQPWSPRGNRAVDIQVLWFTALDTALNLAQWQGVDKPRWKEVKDLFARNFLKTFWSEEKGRLADRIKPSGEADWTIRPNALMALTIPLESPLLTPEQGRRLVQNTVETLLLPYGILSLDPGDENFHPRHENLPWYHKDAAYHNGTIWGWNAGFTLSALVETGAVDRASELTKELTRQILDLGCRGSMSENMDALPDKEGHLVLTGTYSQAWSVSEFSRNWSQDYLGYRPDLLNNRVTLSPRLPSEVGSVEAVFPLGEGGFSCQIDKGTDSWSVTLGSPFRELSLLVSLPVEGGYWEKEYLWRGPLRISLPFSQDPTRVQPPLEVDFAPVPMGQSWPSVEQKNYLYDKILRKE